MSGAMHIQTIEYRVCQEGCSVFATAEEAWKHAAHLADLSLPHLGRIRVQSRRVVVTAGHWADEPRSAPTNESRGSDAD